MKLIEHSVGITSAAGEVLQRIYLHRRILIDVGTNGKGLADPFAEGKATWAFPLDEAIRKATEFHGKCRLLVGIGTASTRRGFGDLTALDADGRYLDVHGYYGNSPKAHAISWIRLKLGELGLGPSYVTLMPESCLVFASNDIVPNYDGKTFSGITNTRARLDELLLAATEEIEPGRAFAVVNGDLERAVFRPIKPDGPRNGPLNTSKGPESDVVWIPHMRAFRSSVVACIDRSSWNETHAHSANGMPVFMGGHLADAVVNKGAEIVVFRPCETIEVRPDTPGAIVHQYSERSSSTE